MMFWMYAGLGFIKLCLTLGLSKACEVGDDTKELRGARDPSEETRLLEPDHIDPKRKKMHWVCIPANKESYLVLTKVCFQQALEAISVGLVVK